MTTEIKADEYVVRVADAQVGPVTLDQLKRGLKAGKIPPDAQARAVSEPHWRPVNEIANRVMLPPPRLPRGSRQPEPSWSDFNRGPINPAPFINPFEPPPLPVRSRPAPPSRSAPSRPAPPSRSAPSQPSPSQPSPSQPTPSQPMPSQPTPSQPMPSQPEQSGMGLPAPGQVPVVSTKTFNRPRYMVFVPGSAEPPVGPYKAAAVKARMQQGIFPASAQVCIVEEAACWLPINSLFDS